MIKYFKIIILISISFTQQPFDGYTLFCPITEGPLGGGDNYTRLIDNNGDIVNQWNHEFCAATAPYLLSDSTLICPFKTENPFLIGSAYGGKIIHYTWDGEIKWEYTYSDTNYLQHHDIEPLPNGNILILAWDRKTYLEAISAGRQDVEGEMWPDKIVELEPIGSDSANIVWEWSFWDHLIQDVDSSLSNYGIISEHPELLDINLGGMPMWALGMADWTHSNSIDYNQDLDQILISSRNMSEIYVIDHSTTSSEAESHSGGNSGKGGDFLYRWGNPINYQRGTPEDRALIGQHDANWINSGYPGQGNIIIYNNGSVTSFGQDLTQSSIIEITSPIDIDNNYIISDESAYAPMDFSWFYTSEFFSHIMSGARRLPNGNTLVTVATELYIFEVDSSGEVVWEYQHDGIGQNSISKAFKFPLDYLSLEPILGDLNNDYSVDIIDIIILVEFILSDFEPTDEQLDLGDLNDDQILNISDILMVIGLIIR